MQRAFYSAKVQHAGISPLPRKRDNQVSLLAWLENFRIGDLYVNLYQNKPFLLSLAEGTIVYLWWLLAHQSTCPVSLIITRTCYTAQSPCWLVCLFTALLHPTHHFSALPSAPPPPCLVSYIILKAQLHTSYYSSACACVCALFSSGLSYTFLHSIDTSGEKNPRCGTDRL